MMPRLTASPPRVPETDCVEMSSIGTGSAPKLRLRASSFALCGVKMANPEQGGTVQIASQMRDPETGIAVALLRVFDGVERRWINRLDALVGFGNFYNRNCSIVLAGA